MFLFLYKSARGDRHQKSVSRNEEVVKMLAESFSARPKESELTVRNYEDTLIAYATVPGYFAYRDKSNGSWFIQILCEVFMNHANKYHIEDLLKMVKYFFLLNY